jgi:hypothetical protein
VKTAEADQAVLFAQSREAESAGAGEKAPGSPDGARQRGDGEAEGRVPKVWPHLRPQFVVDAGWNRSFVALGFGFGQDADE